MNVACAVAILVGIVMVLSAELGSRPMPRRLPTGVAPIARGRRRRRVGGRTVGETEGDLTDVIEHTARDVRSGMALRSALIDALRRQPGQLSGLLDRLDHGVGLNQALAAHEPSTGDARFVVHGLRLAAETGGAVADTLDRVVAVVRERQVWRSERHAQASQARLSARMLTVLPIAVAAWGLLSGPRARDAYADSPATIVLSAFGVVLNITGWWWMRRLVQGPVQQ